MNNNNISDIHYIVKYTNDTFIISCKHKNIIPNSVTMERPAVTLPEDVLQFVVEWLDGTLEQTTSFPQ
jgi:hypothetical protein